MVCNMNILRRARLFSISLRIAVLRPVLVAILRRCCMLGDGCPSPSGMISPSLAEIRFISRDFPMTPTSLFCIRDLDQVAPTRATGEHFSEAGLLSSIASQPQ